MEAGPPRASLALQPAGPAASTTAQPHEGIRSFSALNLFEWVSVICQRDS